MPTRRARIRGVLQEVIAPLLWVFAIAKLIVFDVDVHAIANIAPNWQWVLDFKFFGLLATAVALLLVLGTREFWTLLAFVAGYPFVVLFSTASNVGCRGRGTRQSGAGLCLVATGSYPAAAPTPASQWN